MFKVKNVTTGEMHIFDYGDDGIDWAQDILANHDAYNYNVAAEEYEMANDSIEWWDIMFSKMNRVGDLFDDLRDMLDDDQKYSQIYFRIHTEAGFNDLETQYSFLEALLEAEIDIPRYICQKCGGNATDNEGCTQVDGSWYCDSCDENFE